MHQNDIMFFSLQNCFLAKELFVNALKPDISKNSDSV